MIVFYIIIGLISGVVGGMGMGGGTLLIPLMAIFSDLSQHSAQAINLISFIPMAGVSLFFHFKNKLVKFKGVFIIIISGIFSSVLGVYIAKKISGDILGKIFGGFLILLSVFQIIGQIKKKKD